jgi:hypothetical protein
MLIPQPVGIQWLQGSSPTLPAYVVPLFFSGPRGQSFSHQELLNHDSAMNRGWISYSECNDFCGVDSRRRPRRAQKRIVSGKSTAIPSESRQHDLLINAGNQPTTLDGNVAAEITPINNVSTEDIAKCNLVGDARSLLQSAELSNAVINRIESGTKDERTLMLSWLSPATVELALSASGFRVVQKALEAAGGETRMLLVERIQCHIVSLLESPHVNHVIQKCIEVMPPTAIQFVVDELGSYLGGWPALARHRYGCRVLERLLEHCPESMTCSIIEAIVADTYGLCHDPFGNYVVQHVLEYADMRYRMQVAVALTQADVSVLAQHRLASNVVQRALSQCGAEGQNAMVIGILSRTHDGIRVPFVTESLAQSCM